MALYIRYMLVSAFALAMDVGSYFLLLRLDLPIMAAASIGYMIGVIAHWFGSSRFVFAAQTEAGAGQKAKFLLTALAGTAGNALIIWIATKAGLGPMPAKIVSIIICFHLTLLSRLVWVFGIPGRRRSRERYA